MGFSMIDNMVAQGAAIMGIALVALFPSPSDFADAVFPQGRTEIVSVERVSEAKMEVDVLTSEKPLTETIVIPRLRSCDYDLDELTKDILEDCQTDLARLASARRSSDPLDPDVEAARLALIRLCQNHWGFETNAESLLLYPECASIL